jgi:hypothetical protein
MKLTATRQVNVERIAFALLAFIKPFQQLGNWLSLKDPLVLRRQVALVLLLTFAQIIYLISSKQAKSIKIFHQS